LTTFRPAPVTRRDNRCRFDQMTELVCGQHLSPDMSPPGTTLTLGGGQSVSALFQKSDVDLLGNDEGVIESDI
jgi:hypothetical protein